MSAPQSSTRAAHAAPAGAARLRHAALTLCVAATLCSPIGAQQPQALRWVGCWQARQAYVEDLAKTFTARTGTPVSIADDGDTRGILDVASQRADVGGSCRFTIEGEPGADTTVLKPVAWDALAVIVHKDNPVTNIDFAQLRGVLQGRILSWRELGGPDRPIQLYVRRGKTSGIGRTVRTLLFADYDLEFRAHRYFESSATLEQAVADTAWSLGITGISSARKRDVKVLTFDGKAPSFDNIKSGDYPLYYPHYLVINPTHPEAERVEQFVRFAYSPEGMAIIRRNGTVPYNDALHLVMKKLEHEQRAGASGAD